MKNSNRCLTAMIAIAAGALIQLPHAHADAMDSIAGMKKCISGINSASDPAFPNFKFASGRSVAHPSETYVVIKGQSDGKKGYFFFEQNRLNFYPETSAMKTEPDADFYITPPGIRQRNEKVGISPDEQGSISYKGQTGRHDLQLNKWSPNVDDSEGEAAIRGEVLTFVKKMSPNYRIPASITQILNTCRSEVKDVVVQRAIDKVFSVRGIPVESSAISGAAQSN